MSELFELLNTVTLAQGLALCAGKCWGVKVGSNDREIYIFYGIHSRFIRPSMIKWDVELLQVRFMFYLIINEV